MLWETKSTATEKIVENGATASFFGEQGDDSPGCIAMHPGKIYQARFRRRREWFVTGFIPLAPETPPVLFSGIRVLW